MNEVIEIWKDIPEYEHKYQVSNLGNVRSLNYNNTGKPKILKPKLNKCGYYEISLSKNNKVKYCMIERLVAEAFIPNSNKAKVVTHIDNNKLNNNANNLKWVYKEQIKFLMYKNRNRKGIPSKYKISYKGKKYMTLSEIAKDYNIRPTQLFKRLNNGWTLEETLTIPIDNKNRGNHARFYEYYGEYKTINQISEITGTPAKLIRKRLNRDWNIYEAAEIKKGERKYDI